MIKIPNILINNFHLISTMTKKIKDLIIDKFNIEQFGIFLHSKLKLKHGNAKKYDDRKKV